MLVIQQLAQEIWGERAQWILKPTAGLTCKVCIASTKHSRFYKTTNGAQVKAYWAKAIVPRYPTRI